MLLALRSLYETPRIFISISGVSSFSVANGLYPSTEKRIQSTSIFSSTHSVSVVVEPSVIGISTSISAGLLSGGQLLFGAFSSSSASALTSSHDSEVLPASNTVFINSPKANIGKGILPAFGYYSIEPISVNNSVATLGISSSINTIILYSWNLTSDSISNNITVSDFSTHTNLNNRYSIMSISVTDQINPINVDGESSSTSTLVLDNSSFIGTIAESSSIPISISNKLEASTISSANNIPIQISSNSINNYIPSQISTTISISNKPSNSGIIVSNRN